MNDDLGDIGLNALEALEAQDQEETNPTPDGEDKDTSETGDTDLEDTGEGNNEPDNDSEDADEDEEGGDGSDKEEDTDGKEDEPKPKSEKKELTDEEFEEMAKKRGYSKDKSEEEKKREEEAQAERQATLEKLKARPDEIDEKIWESMPDENKIIYNALPYLTAEGKKGTIQVKTPDQLPEGFEFKSQKAMMQFQNDLQAQEIKATQMSNALASRAQREEEANARREEARMVISEIEGLQKSGALPTPTAKEGTKEFDNDPAVLLINKVLGYRDMRAREGANLSVRDSLLLYKAEHPEEFKKKEAKGDIERKNVAKKVAGNSKSTSSAVNGNEDNNKAKYYKFGMSTEDVLDAVLEDMD